MRKCLVLLVMFSPFFVSAQYDFETRYFTMDESSLPEVNVLNTFTETNRNSFLTKLPDFKISKDNYWKEVDMRSTLVASESFVNSESKIKAIAFKKFGFSTTPYEADASSAVKNIVYKPASGDPCPPFGICAKCAPYRVGKRY